MALDLRDPDDLPAARSPSTTASVYAAAFACWATRAQAQDVVQDVFLRVWRRPAAFDARRGELGAYLRLMARSRALDLWREAQARGRAADRLKLVVGQDEPRVDEQPGDVAERAEDPTSRPRRARQAARRPARGARARLLGRADRRPDRPARARAARDGQEPDPARAGAGCATESGDGRDDLECWPAQSGGAAPSTCRTVCPVTPSRERTMRRGRGILACKRRGECACRGQRHTLQAEPDRAERNRRIHAETHLRCAR